MPVRPSPSHGMTSDEIAADVAESRRRQGLPEFVEDPTTIAKVVALITASGWPPPWANQPDDLGADDPLAEAA